MGPCLEQTRVYGTALWPQNEFEALRPALMRLVPQRVRAQTDAFAVPEAAQRNLLGELLARHALRLNGATVSRETVFELGAKGKPCPAGFDGLHFNISHSGEWVVAAISPAQVGVDIEKVRRVAPGLAKRFFSDSENRLLEAAGEGPERNELFFTLWTIKESFLKAAGTGLSKSLKSFSVGRDGDGRFRLQSEAETAGFHLKVYSFDPAYKLSACSKCPDFADEVILVPSEQLLS